MELTGVWESCRLDRESRLARAGKVALVQDSVGLGSVWYICQWSSLCIDRPGNLRPSFNAGNLCRPAPPVASTSPTLMTP